MLKKIIVCVNLTFLLAGCGGNFNLTSINEEEATNYENQLIKEHDASYKPLPHSVKWLQPDNKKE